MHEPSVNRKRHGAAWSSVNLGALSMMGTCLAPKSRLGRLPNVRE